VETRTSNSDIVGRGRKPPPWPLSGNSPGRLPAAKIFCATAGNRFFPVLYEEPTQPGASKARLWTSARRFATSLACGCVGLSLLSFSPNLQALGEPKAPFVMGIPGQDSIPSYGPWPAR
jgi:hypothetical protein